MTDAPDLTTLAGQRAHYAAVRRRLMNAPQRVTPVKPLVFPSPARPTAQVRDRRIPNMVMSIVCEMSGVRRLDLLSSSRASRLAWPRHIAVYLVHVAVKHTALREISLLFGGREHSTASHSIRTVERNLVAPNPEHVLAVNAVRYCRECNTTTDIFEDCLRRAARLLLQAYMEYIAVRNARWSERMRNKPRPRVEGGKFA